MTVLALNPAFASMHGYTVDELTHLSIESLYPPECRSEALTRLRRVAEHGRQVYEMVHLRKDGSRLPVLVDATSFTGPDGRTYQAVNVLDLSELKAAQGARLEMEARYRVLSEAASDVIATIDVHSTVLFVNPAVERVFGYPPGEVVGRSLTMLMPEYLRRVHKTGIGRYLETGVRHLDWHAVEVPGLHRTGHQIPLEVSFGESGEGDHRTFTGIIRDITARKRTEEHLLHVHRMEAIGSLAGGFAHEVNNQMTVVLGIADFLRLRTDLPDDLRQEVDHVRRAAERSAAITSQLLAFGRRQVLRPEVLPVNLLVEEFEPILRRSIGPGNRIRLHLSPVAGHVRVDRGQLEQVLLNLALNAAHAMSVGGLVTVETDRITVAEAKPLPAAGVSVRAGEYALLRMRDTGHGMDRSTLARVFEPFFTTKQAGEGTGLGLSMAYGIVKQSDGYIWAESEPGQGTTITIQLPAVADQTSPESEESRSAHAGSEAVLVVETDPPVQEIIARGLRAGGYQVLVAASGEEAIKSIERHSGRISLLVAEVLVPEASGRDLAALVREVQPDLPILFVSGYPHDDMVQRGLIDRSWQFLQKPFAPGVLASKVRELLDAASARNSSSLS